MKITKRSLVKSMRMYQDFIQIRTELIPAARSIADNILASATSFSGNKPLIRELIFGFPVKILEWGYKNLQRITILLLAIIASAVSTQINGAVRSMAFVATWAYMIWNIILVYKYYFYNFSDLNDTPELLYARQAVGYRLLAQIGTAETQTCEQLVDALKARLAILATHILNTPCDDEKNQERRTEIKSLIKKAIDCSLICESDDPEFVKDVAESFYRKAFDQVTPLPKST